MLNTLFGEWKKNEKNNEFWKHLAVSNPIHLFLGVGMVRFVEKKTPKGPRSWPVKHSTMHATREDAWWHGNRLVETLKPLMKLGDIRWSDDDVVGKLQVDEVTTTIPLTHVKLTDWSHHRMNTVYSWNHQMWYMICTLQKHSLGVWS